MALTEQTEPVAITDAARRLKLGYWRLRDMILRGEIQGFKIGGRWFVTHASLTERLRKREPAA